MKENSKLTDNLKCSFQIWVRCYNCVENVQLTFRMGTRVHNGTLNLCKCPKCGVRGQMKKVEWNGQQYVRLENG